jgi:hypothetical protein
MLANQGIVQSNFSKIVRNGLVLWLDAMNNNSYPETGTAWNDLSGNGFTATLTNGPTFNSDNGGSIAFDGVNDFVNTNTNLDTETGRLLASASLAWSVSSWFRPDTSNATAGAITARSGGVGTGAIYVVWETGTTLQTRLRGGTILNITTSMTTDWHEVVITWDGTTANAYYDGVFVNTISIGAATSSLYNFSIGGAQAGGTPNTFFLGRVADTKVYNRAITADEVTQNYNAVKRRFNL